MTSPISRLSPPFPICSSPLCDGSNHGVAKQIDVTPLSQGKHANEPKNNSLLYESKRASRDVLETIDDYLNDPDGWCVRNLNSARVLKDEHIIARLKEDGDNVHSSDKTSTLQEKRDPWTPLTPEQQFESYSQVRLLGGLERLFQLGAKKKLFFQ